MVPDHFGISVSVTFDASALLVGKGEGHLAFKNVCCLRHRLLQNHWKRKAGLPGKGQLERCHIGRCCTTAFDTLNQWQVGHYEKWKAE